MKQKKVLTIASIVLIAITSITFYSCKKTKDTENRIGTSDIPLSSNPNSLTYVSTFTDLDKINDHLRHLAFGTASLMESKFLRSSSSNYISAIEAMIEEEETSFANIESTISQTLFAKYNTGAPLAFYDIAIFDGINHSTTTYNTYAPRLNSWSAYDDQALHGFIYSSADYFNLLRIPNWADLQNDPTRLSKPLVVVPNEKDVNNDLILPIIGFTYDPTNNVVNMVQWQTEEDYDAQTTYYVWVVDYDALPIQTGLPDDDLCTGENAPIGNDDYCDIACGENSGNSLNDCNPANIRKVWIEDLEILEDYKRRCGTNAQWLESGLDGQYEIAYQALTAHGRGKGKSQGGKLEERWHRSQINLTRKLGPGCNFHTNGGTSTYKSGVTPCEWWGSNYRRGWNHEKRKNYQPKAYLSENYKPWRDTIYLVIYEFDNVAAVRTRTVNVTTRPGKSYDIEYYTKNNEGPFGDKTNSNTTVAYNTLAAASSLLVPNNKVLMITPGSWPSLGLFSVASDEVTITGVGSGSGANINTYSIKVKLKYGL